MLAPIIFQKMNDFIGQRFRRLNRYRSSSFAQQHTLHSVHGIPAWIISKKIRSDHNKTKYRTYRRIPQVWRSKFLVCRWLRARGSNKSLRAWNCSPMNQVELAGSQVALEIYAELFSVLSTDDLPDCGSWMRSISFVMIIRRTGTVVEMPLTFFCDVHESGRLFFRYIGAPWWYLVYTLHPVLFRIRFRCSSYRIICFIEPKVKEKKETRQSVVG